MIKDAVEKQGESVSERFASPLYADLSVLAAKNADYEVLSYLIKKGSAADSLDSEGKNLLEIVSEASGPYKKVPYKLIDQIEEKIASSLSSLEKLGSSALHYAAAKGDFSLVSRLVNQGADLEKLDKEGKAAIHLAFECENIKSKIDMLRFMLEKLKNKDLRDSEGKTLLDYYILNNNKFLNDYKKLERKSNYPYGEGISYPLFEEIIESYTKDINTQDNIGNTAFHYYSKIDSLYPRMIYVFMKSGADIFIENNEQDTVLEKLFRSKKFGINDFYYIRSEYFKGKEEQLFQSDSQGQNILFYSTNAAQNMYRSYFVDSSEKIRQFANQYKDHQDKDGNTVLHKMLLKNEMKYLISFLDVAKPSASIKNNESKTAKDLAEELLNKNSEEYKLIMKLD
jgi:ankyrin repeat protein